LVRVLLIRVTLPPLDKYILFQLGNRRFNNPKSCCQPTTNIGKTTWRRAILLGNNYYWGFVASNVTNQAMG